VDFFHEDNGNKCQVVLNKYNFGHMGGLVLACFVLTQGVPKECIIDFTLNIE
jgi:hypothetical protein